jgi:primosomal protein N' (replication factor Y)
MKIVRVGLDAPLIQLFDYRADDATEEDLGQRVLVPFGRRMAIGVILEIADSTHIPRERVKAALRIFRSTPQLSAEDLRLLRFAADYYHYPLGQVVLTALPVRLRRLESAPTEKVRYRLTDAGRAVAPETFPRRAVVKRALLEALRSCSSLDSAQAKRIAPSAMVAIKDFQARGWVGAVTLESEPPVSEATAAQYPALTLNQQKAVEAICKCADSFHAFLLCGVTGSGKTEVYLRVAESVLEAGRQVLLLVPEIALTPQLEAMVQARFPQASLVSLHSGLNETERLQNWLAAQSGKARIVLGTRLAIFTPLPQLGLIVVDEEHDASFKQTEGFCYSARDLAVVRASYRNIPVVLGSATPALETYQNALVGRYTLLELPERINGRPPRIGCIALDHRPTEDGLAPRLLEAIAGRLGRREQSLIFINRRGYAPVLTCRACGWLSGCHRCSAQLVLHLPARELHCHHCGHHARVPEACPNCGNPALTPLGQGTQRVEAALTRHFPQARILRIDRDTTRRKHAWAHMRERIRAQEVDILVGTQILAKGHDFPHLALVGVLNADSMLYSADFRAAERLYALLTQVAGRAGRGEAQGEVLIQTEFPEHPLYAALRAQDLAHFARVLLAERQQARFPPFVHQALLRAEAPELATALAFLEHAKERGREFDTQVELYDPVPATMVRLAGRERAQLLVQCASRSELHAFLRKWRERLAEKSNPARWALDIDPIEL